MNKSNRYVLKWLHAGNIYCNYYIGDFYVNSHELIIYKDGRLLFIVSINSIVELYRVNVELYPVNY